MVGIPVIGAYHNADYRPSSRFAAASYYSQLPTDTFYTITFERLTAPDCGALSVTEVSAAGTWTRTFDACLDHYWPSAGVFRIIGDGIYGHGAFGAGAYTSHTACSAGNIATGGVGLNVAVDGPNGPVRTGFLYGHGYGINACDA